MIVEGIRTKDYFLYTWKKKNPETAVPTILYNFKSAITLKSEINFHISLCSEIRLKGIVSVHVRVIRGEKQGKGGQWVHVSPTGGRKETAKSEKAPCGMQLISVQDSMLNLGKTVETIWPSKVVCVC